VLSFILALPQIWGSCWKNILQYICGTIPWQEVHKTVLTVVEKLMAERYDPTLILGVGRGGVVAAGLVCSEIIRIKLRDFKTIGSLPSLPKIRLGIINTNILFKPITSPPTKLRVDRVELIPPEAEVKSDDKILIITTQNFTGSTLEKAIAMVEKMGATRENIKSAALFWQRPLTTDDQSAHEPDIFGEVIGKQKTMPWKSKTASTDRT